ncbi:hypothetical protein G9P44_002459 [Scheffersomyces stipitis]|nr:hypothetical protein G9P44_002459 [Scheffersomyces stipitis]
MISDPRASKSPGADPGQVNELLSDHLMDDISTILDNNHNSHNNHTDHNNDQSNSQSNISNVQDNKTKNPDFKHIENELGPLDKSHPVTKIVVENYDEEVNANRTVSNSHSPVPEVDNERKKPLSLSQQELRRNSALVPITGDGAVASSSVGHESSKISAYARLDFDNFTFFVQTLQVVLGRKSNDQLLQGSHHAVDVHLSSKKAISRRHAKIFYNFGTQRFEISILGRNGAFVDDTFVEKGITVPLQDGTKLQIGDIPFSFVLPSIEPNEEDEANSTRNKQFNPTDAINLRSNIYNSSKSPTPKKSPKKDKIRQDIDEKILEPPPAPKLPVKSEAAEKTKTQRAMSIVEDPHGEKHQSTSRRNSLLKIRRLSNARRKSLASSANDEINDILKELGVASIDAINEEELDSQLQDLLEEHERDDIGIDNRSMIKFSQYSESAIEDEEDEIDKLVKQHNLEQGVVLDDDSQNEENSTHDIDMDLSVLDQEIASLAPLIDAHNQELMKQKEEKRKKLEQEKKKKLQKIDLQRTSPLMGKPTAPRMGKPASIQPPASRIYVNGVGKLQDSSIPANTLASDLSTPFATALVGPPRPPPPVLEAPIGIITAEPATIRSRPPLRAITVKPTANLANFRVPKTNDEPSKFPKQKRRRDVSRKPPKKVYTMDEIPDQFRSKPNVSYPLMIMTVLKSEIAKNGMTINEINEAIKEFYPYYKYCPDGWQFSISHNVKLTKTFRRSVKKGSEWVYTVDELYINEREKVRKKQQELAAAKAKAAAIRAEEIKEKQRLEAQMTTQAVPTRPYTSPYGVPMGTTLHSGSPYSAQLPYKAVGGVSGTVNGDQKPKTIAELASEIRRDGNTSKTPLYFKPQAASPSDGFKRTDATSFPPNTTIKEQLAANRSPSNSQTSSANATASPAPAPASQTGVQQKPGIAGMNQETKKSLAYLQKELVNLYKARKLSYNTATTTEIITKALATTIAQVNVIGAKAGYGDNALSFLVDKAPQQVSKILDIALTKSIKEKQGILSSRPTSRAGTPGPSAMPSPSRIEKPVVPSTQPVQQPQPIAHPTAVKVVVPPTVVDATRDVKPTAAIPIAEPRPQPPQAVPVATPPPMAVTPTVPVTTTGPIAVTTPPVSATSKIVEAASASKPTAATPQASPIVSAALPGVSPSPGPTTSPYKPTALGSGLARPPSYKTDSLGRPPSALSRPQSFGKPGSGLSRPPTFLSNKPGLRSTFGSESNSGPQHLGNGNNSKREHPEDKEDENAKKIARTE